MIESQTPGFTSLLSSLSPDAYIRGKQFERVAKWWLTQDPIRSLDIKQAWLWDEWPQRSGPDIGIDIVAEMFDGTLCAIQAKCFDETRDIPKSELDSFISAASHRTFQHRWLIATTDRLSANARRMLDEQHVTRIMRSDLEESLQAWPTSIDELNPIPQSKYSPRPHQKLAINDVVKGLASNNRGQLIMACGTGKTLTALWIKETLKPRTTLVLVPSLNLLAQTLSEWAKNTSSPWNYLCVCSDETVNKADDQPISTVGDLPFDATTNAEQISDFLALGGEKIIFSTYQSSSQVARAQEQSGVSFDLVICDEAHRLTGKTDADYATVLDEKKIVGQKRLFMTATPRTYTTAAKTKAEDRGVEITSMDDEHVYGPVLHKLSFGEAIKQDLLSDYRVLIVGVTDPQVQDLIDRRELVSVNDSVNTDARTLAAHIGLAKATKDYNLKRTISFHSRIKSADQFAKDHLKILDWLPDTHKPSGNTWTGTISGAMNTGDRRRLIKQLSLDGEDRHALLTNARCLTEGVDVPSLDGVAFIDPRSSQVDIIQAVGRAIRKSKTKEIGTIVLPVLIPIDSDAEEAIEDTAFKPIWAVLNALKSHDEEFAIELSEIRTQIGRRQSSTNLPSRIIEDFSGDIDNLLPGFIEKFSLSIVEKSTPAWDWWYGLLQSYIDEFATSRIMEGQTHRGHHLARWVQAQRTSFNTKRITSERIEKLESLVGWTWNPFEDFWNDHFETLQKLTAKSGNPNIPKRTVFQGKSIGMWCQNQRTAYKSGELLPERIALLNSLSGWSWNILEDNWQSAYEKLERFLQEFDGQYPIAREIYEGFMLGSWVARQRTQRTSKWMTQDRRNLLEALPNWSWQKNLTNESARLEDFLRYINNGGSPKPPPGTSFDGFRVDMWVSVKRRAYKKGTLTAEMVATLEAIPGWRWDPINELWEQNYELLKNESARRGSSLIPIREITDGVKLGAWCQEQRKNYARGALSPERVALLEQIPNWTFTIFEDRWMKMYLILQNFAEIEGHAQPDWKLIFNGERLGTWVHNQCRKYKAGKIDSEQKTLLESLPGWTWTRTSSEWMSTYELVKKFAIENGHSTLPEDYSVQGKNLQSWVHNQKQRRRTGQLEEDRINLMEDLPGWTWDVHGDRWDNSFELLEAFIDHGGTLPPKKDEKYQGLHISSWITTQRRKYREQKLTQEQAKKLSELPNWQWETKSDPWELGLQSLQRYVSVHQSSLVPHKCIFEGFALGVWVGAQRKKYRTGTLSAKQQTILEAFPRWNWSPHADAWNEMFIALTEYVGMTGLAQPPAAHQHKDLNLGMWVSSQRTKFKKGQLETWQIEKLTSLTGWIWSFSEESWIKNFECLVDYIRINGHSNIRVSQTVGDINLGDWVQKQRQAKKKNRLSERQIRLLENVDGWEWEKTSGSGSRPSIKSD